MYQPLSFRGYLHEDPNAGTRGVPGGSKIVTGHSGTAGHFRYFLIFSIIKNDLLHFFQVNLTGSGLFK